MDCPGLTDNVGSIADQLLCSGNHVRPAASNVYVGIRLKIIIYPCNLWHRYVALHVPPFGHTCVSTFHMIRKPIERTFRHTGLLMRFTVG